MSDTHCLLSDSYSDCKMAGPANNGGRRRGAKNYKNEVLTNIIAGILPNGSYGWDQVAAAYMTAAKEENLRDTDDLKRHWVKTLCNGMKKPTGGTGEKGERIHKCIAIGRLILDKTHSGILGLSPDLMRMRRRAKELRHRVCGRDR